MNGKRRRSYLRREDTIALSGTPGGEPELYTILDWVGEGASSVCYTAVRERDGLTGMLKEFYPQHWDGALERLENGQLTVPAAGDEERFAALCREQTDACLALNRAVAADEHSQVLKNYIQTAEPLYGVGGAGRPGTVYIWSSGRAGRSFEAYLEDVRRAPAEQPDGRILDILQTICGVTDCVRCLHQAGWLHLDIQPSNFMILYNSALQDTAMVSLFDLDSLQPIGAGTAPRSAGTEGFRSPRMLTSEPTERDDIYSIGALLYYALAVTEGDSAGTPYRDGMYGRIGETLRASALLQTAWAGPDSELVRLLTGILQKCLAPSAFMPRYENCGQLLEQLERARDMAAANALAARQMSGGRRVVVQQADQTAAVPDSPAYARQMRRLGGLLNVSASGVRQERLPFVGREWLTGQVRAWLADPAGEQICAVFGDMGVGKSAFAANFVRSEPQSAVMFLSRNEPSASDPAAVVRAMAYLCASRVAGYRAQLLDVLEGGLPAGLDASTLFRLLLEQPALDGGQESFCIVIDGLDEAGRPEQNELAQLLSGWASRLPGWLRLLITSQPVSGVRGALGSGVRRLSMSAASDENRADLRAYLCRALEEDHGAEPGFQAAVDELAERSGGVFLYAFLMADAIRKGRASLEGPGRFPVGLDQAYFRYLNWFFPDMKQYRTDFRPALGLLLAAQPLPEEELMRLLGWDKERLHDFRLGAEALLRRGQDEFGGDTLSFSHPYLAQFLGSEDRAERFYVSARTGLELMADRFYALLRDPDGHLTPYEAEHLPALLERTGRHALRDEVMADRSLLEALTQAVPRLCDMENWDAALRFSRLAAASGEAAVAREDGPESRTALSVCYDVLALMLRGTGRLDEALEMSERSRQLLGSGSDRDRLTSSQDIRASVLAKRGQLEEALAIYERLRADLEKRAGEEDGAYERFMLADVNWAIGNILEEQGRPDEALERYERARKVLERLVRQDRDGGSLLLLSDVCCSMGQLLYERMELDRALPFARESVRVLEELPAEKGDTPLCRRSLAYRCTLLGYMLDKQAMQSGQPEGMEQALTAYEKALALCRRMAEEDPSPQNLDRLGEACVNKGCALAKRGRSAQALTMFAEAAQTLERVPAGQGSRYLHELTRIMALTGQAEILEAGGRADEALALYERVWREGDREDPDRRIRLDLAQVRTDTAGLLARQDRPEEALAVVRESIGLLERMVRERQEQKLVDALSMAYVMAVELLTALGRQEEAEPIARRLAALQGEDGKTDGRQEHGRKR